MSAVRLCYPPEARALWRLLDGRVLKAPAYRDWMAAARAAIRASALPAVFGPYRLTIIAHRPCEAGEGDRDIDTLLGPLTAALTAAGVIGGESLAERIVIRWSREAAPGGQLDVEVCRA